MAASRHRAGTIDADADYFFHTPPAAAMKKRLERNDPVWAHKTLHIS